MSQFEQKNVRNAQERVLLAIDNKFATTFKYDVDNNYVDIDEFFFRVEKAPNYKNVYFVNLNKSHEIARYCPLVRKRQRMHSKAKTAYSVNIATGKVSCVCFSGKCKERNGGKYILVVPDDFSSSSEDPDFESSDDDTQQEKPTTTKKRKREDDK